MNCKYIILSAIWIGGLFSAAIASEEPGAGGRKDERPNILVFMADDLDVGQLSCYGGENLKTIHIDRLAAEGLKFNTTIASEAMCVPTRASLLTGLYPLRHGAYQNHKPVYDDLKSVVHYLNDLGYRVGLTGKDHMTKPKSVFPFDLIDGFEPNCVADTDEYFLDSVRNYILQDEPYCLFVMSINPHVPWTVGNPDEFDPDQLKLPPHWVDTEHSRSELRKYLAEVRRLDDQVGDITNLLKETGKDKNTIVIFLGEQGPQFPGGKWGLYDYGQKSAMIVKWPGVVAPETETDAIVQYEDVTPTLVDIVGGKPIKGLDGRSFKGVLEGKNNRHRDVAYGIHNNIPEGPAYPIRSIRDDQYKLLVNLLPDSAYYIKYMMNTKDEKVVWTSWVKAAEHHDKARELTERIAHRPAIEFYDILKDPFELNNLAADPAYQTLIDTYMHQLKEWMHAQGDPGAAIDVLSVPGQLSAQETRELFLADPTIYVENGTYYLTGTGGSGKMASGFSVWESKDLKKWTVPAGANDSVWMILRNGEEAFGTEGFWAPQLFKVDDTYHLTYTANEQTVLAQSPSVLGPFGQKKIAPIDGSEKNIDSYIFKDEDGKYYLYHVRFDNGNYLWVAEFDIEKGAIKKETLRKCFGQTEPWEATPAYESSPIMEGPTVVKLKDKYYLFYSANHFRNIDYSVGYAVADSPYGPWVKQKDSPIIHRSIVGENGAGHGDLFEGIDGQLYYVYHVHFSQQQVGPRRTRIVPLTRQWDAEKGYYTFRVKGDEVIKPVVNF